MNSPVLRIWKWIKKRKWAVPFLLIVLAAEIGAEAGGLEDDTLSSTVRRARSLERIWYGIETIFGVNDIASSALLWLARTVVVVALALVVKFIIDHRRMQAASRV